MGDGAKKEKNKKRKRKFDEDESPESVTLPVMVVGKEDTWLFSFPKLLGTTLLHQLIHPRCITRILLAVEPPGFTKGD
jgi:hypothetical protein